MNNKFEQLMSEYLEYCLKHPQHIKPISFEEFLKIKKHGEAFPKQ